MSLRRIGFLQAGSFATDLDRDKNGARLLERMRDR